MTPRFPIRITGIMILPAGEVAVFLTGGAYDIDLGQLFAKQLQIPKNKKTRFLAGLS